MPRQLAELKQFSTGIKSSPSDTDIHPESAIYNTNIDPISEAGKLRGIRNHQKVIPSGGNISMNIFPPWNGNVTDGEGNFFPDATPANQIEGVTVSINDIEVTVDAINTGTTREINDTLFASLKTAIEGITGADSLIESVSLSRASNAVGELLTVDTLTTATAFTASQTNQPCTLSSAGTGVGSGATATYSSNGSGNLTAVTITAGGQDYEINEPLIVTESAGTPGVGGCDCNTFTYPVAYYGSDGLAYSVIDANGEGVGGNEIADADLSPYRGVGIEFKDTVASVDVSLTYRVGAATVRVYEVGEVYDGSETMSGLTTWKILQDDTLYLGMNATEMESFNDEAKNHIAFYSITDYDDTSDPAGATTHRMKVFDDVYGTKDIVTNYTNDEGVAIYYDIPGGPADVTIEKNNAQIYVGTGNTLASKTKWFGKIKHKQFAVKPEGYRMFDSEALPIDNGEAVFNLSDIDYAYDGLYNGVNYDRNWDPGITYGISPGTLYLYGINTEVNTDSGTNTDLGVQKRSDTKLTFTPTAFYSSRWLWTQLNELDSSNGSNTYDGTPEPWTPPGATSSVLDHSHGTATSATGVGHSYMWMTDKYSSKLHIISVDGTNFLAADVLDTAVMKSFAFDFNTGTQTNSTGSRVTDVIETTNTAGTATRVYVLYTQKSDTPYTFDEEFVFYFDPATDLHWNSLTATLHECTPPSPKLKFYSSYRSGSGMYVDENVMYPDFHTLSHDYWAGTWNVKSNYMYWRYTDHLGEPAAGSPNKDSVIQSHSNFNSCKGNHWEHRRMDAGGVNPWIPEPAEGWPPPNKWDLGTNLGWAEDEDYAITPHRKGFIDLQDGYNSIGLICHVKGKFVTDAGEIKNKTYNNWTPRYHYMYGDLYETESYDEVVMYNINPTHEGVRERHLPHGYLGADFHNTPPAVSTIDETGEATPGTNDSTGTAGVYMSGFGVKDGKSRRDHHIYKFKSGENTTNYPNSNEIHTMPADLSGIQSICRRLYPTTESTSATNRMWMILQGDDGTDGVLAAWDFAKITSGTNPIKELEISTQTYEPMIFSKMGTPAIAITVPKTSDSFKFIAGGVTGVDYAMQMSATQGEYFVGRATYEHGISGGNQYGGYYLPIAADTNTESPYLSYYSASVLPFGLSFTNGDIEEDADKPGNFTNGGTYYYKMTLMYDGFQESPLNNYYFQYKPTSGGNNYNTVVIAIRLSKPAARCSSLQIYRKNDVEEFYRLVGEQSFKSGWGFDTTTEEYFSVLVDDGTLSATYEAITGMPESLRDTGINYKLSCSAGGYLVVANCFHKDITNGQNFIFRSQPGNFSVFNWSRDFTILPNEPTAIAYWAGRLYAFDKANMYKIDLNSLAIEDIHEGVGCFGEQSFVITDYGMFFCDSNNMYRHNGTNITPIGNDILKNSKLDDLGITNKAWHNITHAYDPYVQYDAFNQNVMFQFEDVDGTYGSWNYNIPRKRWDLVDIPKPRASVQGNLGELWLSDSDYIYKLGEGSGRKKWSHYTPSLDFNYATVDKRLKRLKIIFNSAADIAASSYTLKIYADETLIDLTKSIIKDEENVRTYRLKGTEVRRVKKVRLEILDSNVEIDSFGISYSLRTIK